MQLGGLGGGGDVGGGGHCKLSPVGFKGEAPENFGYLAFCGAQNIVFVAVYDDKQWLKLTSEYMHIEEKSEWSVICLFYIE